MLSDSARSSLRNLQVVRDWRDVDKLIAYIDNAIQVHRNTYDESPEVSDFQRGKLAAFIDLRNKLTKIG